MPETKGERLFREYLDVHGYRYDRPDQDDRTRRAADFRIFRDGAPLAIAEVKQWDTFASPYPPAGSSGSTDPRRLFKPVRRSIDEAASQLKGTQG